MGIRTQDTILELGEEQAHWPGRVLKRIHAIDPRYSIAMLLFSYLVLGFTVLGFNRTPYQALVTTVVTCLFEVVLARVFRKKWVMPLSALITSFSLSILLNYSHNFYVLFVPIFFAIGSKYLLTFKDKHLINPAQAGVSFSLLFASSLITSSPAYQWNGLSHMGVFIAGFGIFLLVPSVKRFPLVLSFLFFFTLQILFRAWLMKHHLPFETLFLGTITSPAFFLFTFFMITDPATSPKDTKIQIYTGFALAFLDLVYHLYQSYHTFFFAALTLQSSRLLYMHGREAWRAGIFKYFKTAFIQSGYWQRPLILGFVATSSLLFYQKVVSPKLSIGQLPFEMVEIMPEQSGINPVFGDVLKRVDPRVQHMIKWLMSVGDAVAVGDFDQDGLPDLFFTNTLKSDGDRNSLYRNLGNFQFERVPLAMIKEKTFNVEEYGVPSNAMFVDYDNDGDLDIFITYAFGSPILLKNGLMETGKASFRDVTKEVGLDLYTNSISANFIDINNNGRLDLIIGNVWPKYLPDYPADNPQKLNLFRLPQPEYEGDIRMFNFVHESWHMADNGGVNDVLFQDENGRFQLADAKEIGMPEHFWTLAIGTGDLNQDGWTDIYIANDFGPDQLYYNQGGKKFKKIEGKMFGSIGKDTYKGMNVSMADIDNNGMLDVYVSNVHHQLQAEGSMLWMFFEGKEPGVPLIVDEATKRNALNEERFGWGASIADFDNDGLYDIAQANGMVDDSIDKVHEKCPDFWYVNEKIARSPPEIHRYVHNWGDIRGSCIYGKERNRLYLNTGSKVNTFIDVADKVGMTKETNSRGMAAVDLDNDGKMDLVVTHQFARPTIYNNTDIEQEKFKARSWIGFELRGDGKSCNKQAIGSKLTLTFTDEKGELQKRYKEVQLVSGFTAQNDIRQHFGLGQANLQLPVNLQITWCNGKTQNYENLVANKYSIISM